MDDTDWVLVDFGDAPKPTPQPAPKPAPKTPKGVCPKCGKHIGKGIAGHKRACKG